MKTTTTFTLLAILSCALTAYSQTIESSDLPAHVHATNAPQTWPDGEVLPTPEKLQQTVGFGLLDLEQLALQNNPTLAQARARVQAARGRQQQAGLYPNPVIGYSGGEIGNEGRAGQQGGYVGQELVTAGKLRLSRQVAGQEVVRLQQEVAVQQFRVLTDVRSTFYDVLVAQRTVELTTQLVQLAEEGIKAAEALLKAQEGSRVDLLQARVEANTTRILFENAQKRHQGAWRRLATLVGMPDMTVQQLAGDAEQIEPPLKWEVALSRVLSESPELAAAAAAVETARCATQRARVEWIPNVDVQAGVQHDNASGDNIAGVQFAIPLPVYNRNQGNIAAANAELVAAHRNVDRVRLGLQNRLAEVFQRYATYRQQVEKYRRAVLPDAKETLDLVAQGYKQGEFSYLNLLTAQRTYFQSNLAYLESLLQLRQAHAEIEGLLLSNSFEGLPQ